MDLNLEYTIPNLDALGFELSVASLGLIPIDLSEAKSFLRVNHNEDDNMIRRYIKTATLDIENYIGRSIEKREHTVYWRRVFTSVHLPRPPHSSITSIKTIDKDGNETTLTTDDYYKYGMNEFEIELKSYTTQALKVVYDAGYATTLDDVPEGLRDAILEQLPMYYTRSSMADGLVIDDNTRLTVQAMSAAQDYVYHYATI